MSAFYWQTVCNYHSKAISCLFYILSIRNETIRKTNAAQPTLTFNSIVLLSKTLNAFYLNLEDETKKFGTVHFHWFLVTEINIIVRDVPGAQMSGFFISLQQTLPESYGIVLQLMINISHSNGGIQQYRRWKRKWDTNKQKMQDSKKKYESRSLDIEWCLIKGFTNVDGS